MVLAFEKDIKDAVEIGETVGYKETLIGQE